MKLKIQKNKIDLIDVILFVIIISIIYQSGSVRAALPADGILFYLTRVTMIVPTFFLVIKEIARKKYINFIIWTISLIIVPFIINSLIYQDGTFSLFYKFILFELFALLIYKITDEGKNIELFIYKIIIGIAFITLLFYFLIEILKIKFPYTYIYIYRNYFEIFFSYHYTMKIPRLSGLFWEPGMYQIYLNIALFLYVYMNKKNKFEFLVLLTSIVLTQSTAGYCIATVLIAVLIFKSKKISPDSKFFLFLICSLFAVIIVCCFVLLKKNATNYRGGSYSLRTLDIINGFKVFMSSPVFGVGFGNEKPFMSHDMFERGSSNGLISLLYMTGIIGIIIFLCPFIIRIKQYNKDREKNIVWFIIVIAFNIFEPIYNLPIMVFILSREYVYIFKKDE